MSRSNPQEQKLTNPAKKFLRWNSKDSVWRYWDKEAEEGRTVDMDIPFIVLDCLSTATGFNDRKSCGIWSNEVRSPKDEMRVQDKDGEIASGPWRSIKEKVHYAKFCTSVYAMAKIGYEYELVNFQLSGCALGPWIEFTQEQGGTTALYEDLVVKVGESVEGRKGSVTFNSPQFVVATRTLSEEARQQAEDMDKVLQAYLEAYLANSPQAKAVEQHSKAMEAYEAPEPPDRSADPEPMPEDDVPF